MSAIAEVPRFSNNVRSAMATSAADEAITNAIIAANYAQNGVTFEPFTVAIFPGVDVFNNIWNSERGDTPITFFQSNGAAAAGSYLPLGDIVVVGASPAAAPAGVMLFAPSAAHPDSLANPVGFQWLLDDSGSGNSRDLSYFRMIAPEGYSPVGICFKGSGDAPNPANYWCVKNQYLQTVSYQTAWSDAGQRFRNHNGNLNVPSFAGNPPAAPTRQMLMLPPTFLSDDDIGNEGAFGLMVQSANLPVTAFPSPAPTYDPNASDGDTTPCGVTSVKVVPYTAVSADAGFVNQAITSPFYYVAAEPYWECVNVFPTPAGGSFEVSQTIGTSESESRTSSESTSISVSAEFGAKFGPASASVSATFTKEWGLTTETTVNHSTEATNNVTINFPQQAVTWTWQRQTQIAVYRTDLSQLPSTTYANSDMRFVPSGTPTVLHTKRIK